MKIAIGTAQFGEHYGVVNQEGQVPLEIVKQILIYAKNAGINDLDTASLYGESEKCLGKLDLDSWNINTKLRPVPYNCKNIYDWTNIEAQKSLSRLCLDKVNGFMLHRPNQLIDKGGNQLWSSMENLKTMGLTKKIGYSMLTSDPKDFEKICTKFIPDIIQVPFSIFDQRFKNSGWMEKLFDMGVEIHVRSIFLQGLLIQNRYKRLKKFERWNVIWDKWEAWLDVQQITSLEACLSFVASHRFINYAVIGVDSLYQIEQITSTRIIDGVEVPKDFSCSDLNLIEPSNWSAL